MVNLVSRSVTVQSLILLLGLCPVVQVQGVEVVAALGTKVGATYVANKVIGTSMVGMSACTKPALCCTIGQFFSDAVFLRRPMEAKDFILNHWGNIAGVALVGGTVGFLGSHLFGMDPTASYTIFDSFQHAEIPAEANPVSHWIGALVGFERGAVIASLGAVIASLLIVTAGSFVAGSVAVIGYSIKTLADCGGPLLSTLGGCMSRQRDSVSSYVSRMRDSVSSWFNDPAATAEIPPPENDIESDGPLATDCESDGDSVSKYPVFTGPDNCPASSSSTRFLQTGLRTGEGGVTTPKFYPDLLKQARSFLIQVPTIVDISIRREKDTEEDFQIDSLVQSFLEFALLPNEEVPESLRDLWRATFVFRILQLSLLPPVQHAH